MSLRKRRIAVLLTMILMVSFTAFVAIAEPIGPDSINRGASSRRDNNLTGKEQDAIAGNVTELTITATATTKRWQGFYGNVTGSIVLANSADNILYDWSQTSPSGQIYAARTDTITWADVVCANAGNISAEETALGTTSGASDSVTNTFSETNHPAFNIGTRTITTNSCPSTRLYNASGVKAPDAWYEALLATSDSYIVYTAILEDGVEGFDGSGHDFQMLVGEDGDTAGSTPYYFWVELV